MHTISSAREMSSKSTVSRDSSSGNDTERKLELQELVADDFVLEALLRPGVVGVSEPASDEAMTASASELYEVGRTKRCGPSLVTIRPGALMDPEDNDRGRESDDPDGLCCCAGGVWVQE